MEHYLFKNGEAVKVEIGERLWRRVRADEHFAIIGEIYKEPQGAITGARSMREIE